MKRLTRREKYTGQVLADSDNYSIRSRLAEYEEAEENGSIMAVSAAERQLILAWRAANQSVQTGVSRMLMTKEAASC